MKSLLHTLSTIGLFALLSFLTVNCSDRNKIPPLPPEETNEEFTSNVNAKIYFDATESMVGFVTPELDTRYGKIIDALEGAIISGWIQTSMDFFGFGDEIIRLEDRKHIRAKEPSFYHNTNINRITRIQRVIDQVKTSALTLILTDLFQDGADVNILVQQLKEKCFLQNLTFGIIGVRSEFDGYIYDLGPNRPAFYYRSQKQKVNTYRPFYILLMGRYADIKRFYERLKASGLGFNLDEAIIYPPFIANGPATFKNVKIDSTFSLSEVPNLIRLAPNESRIDPRIKQFRIQGDPEVAAIVATFPYFPARYTIPFDANFVDVEILATQCLPDTFLLKPEAVSAVRISISQVLGNKMKMRLEIFPIRLPGDGVYFYEIVLRPKPEAYQMPTWFSAWDMDKAKMPASGRNASVLPGASTLNLYRLLANLCSTNIVVHQPYIAKLYCCFKK